MNISFTSLSQSHFSLLLKWLEEPHVKAWWDRDINYTEDLVKEKYTSYTQGYKLENGVKKAIHSFVIYIGNNPIGYIQIYHCLIFLNHLLQLTFLLAMQITLGKALELRFLEPLTIKAIRIF